MASSSISKILSYLISIMHSLNKHMVILSKTDVHHTLVFLPVDSLSRLTLTAAFDPFISVGESYFLDQRISHLQRKRGLLTVVCTLTLKLVSGQRNTKCIKQFQSQKPCTLLGFLAPFIQVETRVYLCVVTLVKGSLGNFLAPLFTQSQRIWHIELLLTGVQRLQDCLETLIGCFSICMEKTLSSLKQIETSFLQESRLILQRF